MYIYIYVYKYTYIYICIFVHIHVYTLYIYTCIKNNIAVGIVDSQPPRNRFQNSWDDLEIENQG